jgi:putative membrane protein
MKRICLASLAIVAVMGAGCNKNNAAARNDTAGTSGRVEVSSGDRDFVQDVSRMNAAEVDLSRLAVDRASNSDVRSFAQMMVDDHAAAGDKLSSLATQQSIDAPATADDAHVKTHEKLATRQALDFDKDYIDAMIDDHGNLVDKLESRIDRADLTRWKGEIANPVSGDVTKVKVSSKVVLPEKSDDPVTQRINQWAADTYPTAYAHLQAAKALKDTLKKRST